MSCPAVDIAQPAMRRVPLSQSRNPDRGAYREPSATAWSKGSEASQLSCSPPPQSKYAADHAGYSLPVLRLFRELLQPAFCNRIEFCFTVILRNAPLWLD